MDTQVKDVMPTNPVDFPQPELDESHSPFKVLSHPELLKRFKNGEEFHPIHLRIGITGSCNMRCHFCNFHSGYEDKFYDLFSFNDSISTEDCLKLIAEFAQNGGRAMTFCGSGECTTHTGYVEICEAAHAAGIKIGLITNGATLSRTAIADVVRRTHTWVRIGLNAGSAETFANVTKVKPKIFDDVLSAIRPIRDGSEMPDFRIGFNYVITGLNYKEILQAATLAKASGAFYVRYEPEFYSGLGHDTIGEQMVLISDLLRKSAALADEKFEVSVPKLDRGPMDQTDQVEGDFKRCHYSRFVTAIGADGNLYPCPQVHLNSRYRIGSVIDQGYAAVIDGGPRREWEEENPMRTELCKSCFYRPQNELLERISRGEIDLDSALSEYKIEVPSTLHAEFV